MVRRIAKVNSIGGPSATLSVFKNVQSSKTYEQMNQLICKFNPPANNIAQHFSDENLKMEDFFHDFYPLQFLWAKEQKFAMGVRRFSQTRILLEQLRRGSFDCILFQGALPKFEEGEFIQFRKENPGISLVMAHIGHRHDRHHLQGVDLILGANHELSEWYDRLGFQSETLWHSFDESTLDVIEIPSWEVKQGFCFTGSSGHGLESHKRRYQVLREMVEKIPGKYFLEENNPLVLPRKLCFSDKSLMYELKVRLNKLMRDLSLNQKSTKRITTQLKSLFPSIVNDEVYGLEMYKLLAQSKITLQIHQSAATSAGALRLFEATGLGVCLVTDGENLDSLFTPDRDIIRIRSHAEIVEVIETILRNDLSIREVAESGRKRTMQFHTSRVRSKEFRAIVDRVC